MHSQRPSPDPFPLTPPPAVGPNDGRRNNFFHGDGPARVGNARMQMPACQVGQWGVVYVARRPQVRPGQCASAQFEVWASGMYGGGARLRQRCDKGARVVCRSFFRCTSKRGRTILEFVLGTDDVEYPHVEPTTCSFVWMTSVLHFLPFCSLVSMIAGSVIRGLCSCFASYLSHLRVSIYVPMIHHNPRSHDPGVNLQFARWRETLSL